MILQEREDLNDPPDLIEELPQTEKSSMLIAPPD